MDATAPAPVVITTTPLINIADQPADLSTDAGRTWLVEQACWLSQQVANRGDPAAARANLSSKAIPQANAIYDANARNTALSYISIVSGYIDSIAPQASSLEVQAGISDQSYQNSQVLTAAQLQDANNDNADTQAMLAGTLSPTAYGLRIPDVERSAQAAVDKTVAGATQVADNLKWYFLGAGIFILAALALVAYMSKGKSVSVST